MATQQSFMNKYYVLRKRQILTTFKKARKMKICYFFILPYILFFFTFLILPIASSIGFSFTSYNILEAPKFTGMSNYIRLILQDEVFLTSVKNTFILAIVTGPIGYILSFMFAWFINELPHWLRTIAVVVFYAPSIAGNAYTIFSIIFRGDAYGYLNSMLLNLSIVDAPVQWLMDPQYIMIIIIVVTLWMSMGTGFLSFVAGLQGVDHSIYEAGYVDGVRNRWQELYYITLPSMKPMLLFGAIMSITSAFNVSDVPRALAGYPSTDYAARTVVTHLFDYGFSRFEMGYASAIATLLFLVMILCKKAVSSLLGKVGT